MKVGTLWLLLVAQTKSHTDTGERAAFRAIRFPGADRIIRAGRPFSQPCFSPHNRGERFLVPNLGFRCRRWHPAKTPGVLRIASSVLHILSQTNVAPYRRSTSPRAKGSAGTFQRGSLRLHLLELNLPETRFSKALSQVRAQTERTHGVQQARMNSRNQTTIASDCKHRQPVFCSNGPSPMKTHVGQSPSSRQSRRTRLLPQAAN